MNVRGRKFINFNSKNVDRKNSGSNQKMITEKLKIFAIKILRS
jgi:hypothetical protein